MCTAVRYDDVAAITGVIQAVNKSNGGVFEGDDLDLLRYVARTAGISIHRFIQHREIVQAKHLTEARMKLRNLFTHDVRMDDVLHEIQAASKILFPIQAQTLYLVDGNEMWVADVEQILNLRIPVGFGLAGRCASIQEMVNVADAYEDKSFNRAFDLLSGFRTKSVLCVPIFVPGEPTKLAAVLQCMNRLEDRNSDDEDATKERGE